MSDNIGLTKEEMSLIRNMPDFDLIMFISEMHDHGAVEGISLLYSIRDAAISCDEDWIKKLQA